MFNWFKKYFIPHEHNNHKPHILRLETTLFLLGLVIFFEFLFLIQVLVVFPKINFFAQILENVLVDETNNSRLTNNLLPLKTNTLLMEAAQAKAEDMAKKSYFSHVSPEGTMPWYWIGKTGYEYTYAGENLAINFSDSKDVMGAWMNSPKHRDNILNGYFTEIGIGLTKGIYQDKETVFIVQMFGRSAEIAVITPPKSATPEPQMPVVDQPKTESTQPAATVSEESQMFVAVKSDKETKVLSAEAAGNKAEAKPLLSFSALAKEMLVAPRVRTAYIFLVILAVISLALILNIFIKSKIQHPGIIANGIALIFIINAMLFINYCLVLLPAKIF